MRTYHKIVIFTRVPLNGCYKYKDVFQVYPMKVEGQPESEFCRHFPNFIEFWTDSDEVVKVPSHFSELDEDLWSNLATWVQKKDRVLMLLTTFTNHRFFSYSDTVGSWGIHLDRDEPKETVNKRVSKWVHKLYLFPELNEHTSIKEFTFLEMPEIKKWKHRQYYSYDPNLDSDHKKYITVPFTIDLMFDSYFSKNEDVKDIIIAAAYHVNAAVENHDTKKTLSLLSSFTALEAMVNLEYIDFKPGNCECCGQPQYKVAKKFRDYLLKYIGDSPNNKKKFNKYYSLRSKIVHTGVRLKSELLFADISAEEEDKEFVSRMEILQLGRLSVIQWLLSNP